jgi:hypothetical protein
VWQAFGADTPYTTLFNGAGTSREEIGSGNDMITFQRLASFIFAEPFRPFRIRMVGGQALEIRHPDTIGIGRSSARVDFFMSEDPILVKEGARKVPFVSMESVEPIDVAVATRGK